VDAAIQNLTKAINRDPDYVQALATLGSAYLTDKQYDEARKALNKALELAPAFGPAWNNMCLLELELGNIEKAREYAAKAEETGYELAEEVKKELEAEQA
jgi:Flp pilus assembly protein TadD